MIVPPHPYQVKEIPKSPWGNGFHTLLTRRRTSGMRERNRTVGSRQAPHIHAPPRTRCTHYFAIVISRVRRHGFWPLRSQPNTVLVVDHESWYPFTFQRGNAMIMVTDHRDRSRHSPSRRHGLAWIRCPILGIERQPRLDQTPTVTKGQTTKNCIWLLSGFISKFTIGRFRG